MRLAVLSDIHGNIEALKAVLTDLEAAGGADTLWVLGDLAAFGPDPSACIQQVRDLKDAKVIHGNTDRYLMTGIRHKTLPFTEENWSTAAEKTRERDAMFTWALERMTWEDMKYLQELGTDLALEVEDYGWVIGFHAMPGDDEGYLLPDTPDHEVRDALLDREGSLALGGHTHRAMDRAVGGGWRMVNPGSVGFPFDGDPRAAYAILTFEEGRVKVDLRRVAYDIEATISALAEGHFPALELMTHRLRNAKQ
jgi:predicted phosphodiesterase